MTAVYVDPIAVEASRHVCECCANRGLHMYRTDCMRCFARDMARAVPRLARAERMKLDKVKDAEWMATLRRMVGEERKADAAAGYGHPEARA